MVFCVPETKACIIPQSSAQFFSNLSQIPRHLCEERAQRVEKELRGAKQTKTDEAKVVGRLVAERAKAAGVSHVVFDRAGFRYHGRVRSLADAAREAGLEF